MKKGGKTYHVYQSGKEICVWPPKDAKPAPKPDKPVEPPKPPAIGGGDTPPVTA